MTACIIAETVVDGTEKGTESGGKHAPVGLLAKRLGVSRGGIRALLRARRVQPVFCSLGRMPLFDADLVTRLVEANREFFAERAQMAAQRETAERVDAETRRTEKKIAHAAREGAKRRRPPPPSSPPLQRWAVGTRCALPVPEVYVMRRAGGSRP